MNTSSSFLTCCSIICGLILGVTACKDSSTPVEESQTAMVQQKAPKLENKLDLTTAIIDTAVQTKKEDLSKIEEAAKVSSISANEAEKVEKQIVSNSQKKVPSIKKKEPIQKAVKKTKKPKPIVKKSPSIAFKEKTMDFGEIFEGDEVEHKFLFKNTGTADLEILDAKVTCGCTHPSYPFLAIPAGETGFIGVTYKSVGKFGKQNPKISVSTNVSSEPIDLYLNGFVKKKPKEDLKDADATKVETDKSELKPVIDVKTIDTIKETVVDTSAKKIKNGK